MPSGLAAKIVEAMDASARKRRLLKSVAPIELQAVATSGNRWVVKPPTVRKDKRLIRPFPITGIDEFNHA